jgi:hypothetical protein
LYSWHGPVVVNLGVGIGLLASGLMVQPTSLALDVVRMVMAASRVGQGGGGGAATAAVNGIWQPTACPSTVTKTWSQLLVPPLQRSV